MTCLHSIRIYQLFSFDQFWGIQIEGRRRLE